MCSKWVINWWIWNFCLIIWGMNFLTTNRHGSRYFSQRLSFKGMEKLLCKSNHSELSPHTCQDGYDKDKKQKLTSAGEDAEKLEPLHTLDGNAKWYSCSGKWYGGPLKHFWKRTTIWSNTPTYAYLSERIKIRISKRYEHFHVHHVLFTIVKIRT